MPNPLLNRQMVTSKPTQQHALEPIEEEYEGENFAYRGTQTHGVEPTEHSGDPIPEYSYERTEPGTKPAPKDDPDPIPVRVVNESAREEDRWAVTRMAIVEARAHLLVNRIANRTNLFIRNDGPETLWVGPDGGVSPSTGFAIPVGASMTLNGDAEVWATVEVGETAVTYCMWEFKVSINRK